MRTTVDIPDSLYRQLKSIAALRGSTVRELIVRGIEAQVTGDQGKKRGRITLPLIVSKNPGQLDLTNQTIDEILLP